MKKKKTLMIMFGMLLLAGVLAGCGPQWLSKQRPETPEERQAVAKHEIQILSNIPQTLSGNDQDWDDAIAEAHRIAVKTWCKTRLYEFIPDFNGGEYTGRYKEISQK